MNSPLSDKLVEAAVRAVCRERCASMGDKPCWEIAPNDWNDGTCEDCPAFARAALEAARAALKDTRHD